MKHDVWVIALYFGLFMIRYHYLKKLQDTKRKPLNLRNYYPVHRRIKVYILSKLQSLVQYFNQIHYNYDIMATMASQSLASRLFTESFIRAQIKENIKAPRRCPLCGEFTGTGEFPTQRASNVENVSVWWRQHVRGMRYRSYSCESIKGHMRKHKC